MNEEKNNAQINPAELNDSDLEDVSGGVVRIVKGNPLIDGKISRIDNAKGDETISRIDTSIGKVTISDLKKEVANAKPVKKTLGEVRYL